MDFQYTGRYSLCRGGYAKTRHSVGPIFIIHLISIWFKSSSKVQHISLINAKNNGNHLVQPVVNEI